MLTVSDNLYGSYQETEYFHFLFAFLRENARGPAFLAALNDEQRCRDLWAPHFDPDRERMDLALRHAFVLGSEVAGEPVGGAIPEDVSNMQMKALLDNWGFVPFSTFDRADV